MRRGIGQNIEKARAVRRQPPLIQMCGGDGRTPLTLKIIGECRRTNDEQAHLEIYKRPPSD